MPSLPAVKTGFHSLHVLRHEPLFWCIRRAVNPVGGGRRGGNPPRTDAYWSRLRTSPYEQIPGGRAFYVGMDTQYPDTIKRGRSSCLRNRGGGTGRIRTGTMSGYVVPKRCHLRYCPIWAAPPHYLRDGCVKIVPGRRESNPPSEEESSESSFLLPR